MSEPQTLCISFSDFESQRVAVTQLDTNVYRLEWTPIVLGELLEDEEQQDIELYLGDIIQTETKSDGTLVFVRVLERAKFRHYSWVVSKEFSIQHRFTSLVPQWKLRKVGRSYGRTVVGAPSIRKQF